MLKFIERQARTTWPTLATTANVAAMLAFDPDAIEGEQFGVCARRAFARFVGSARSKSAFSTIAFLVRLRVADEMLTIPCARCNSTIEDSAAA